MGLRMVAIVDHDPSFCDELNDLLQQAGYATRMFRTLEGTYETLAAERPSAAIIGLHFPESRHGIDLVTVLKLRPETRDIPIILTSADLPFLLACGERLRERAVPAVWTLARPIDRAEMLRILARALPS